MTDELEKRWNKSHSQSNLRHENERKLLQQKDSQHNFLEKKDELFKKVPYTEIVFCTLIIARMYSALTSHITDCDETYNFWEPTHHLAFGNGFQTWEYNPKYALRSYLYVGMHAAVVKLCSFFVWNHKVFVFYMLRMSLGIFCAVSEDQFYSSIYKRFGSFIANCWLLITLFAPGMFISSSAYLPSSFAMYSVTIAYAAWLNGSDQMAVIWIGVASVVGWPFVAILGIPIFWDIVIENRQFWKFVKYFFIALGIAMIPLVIVDFIMYNKVVIAPLNIIFYNVFNIHGSTLYGTEPMSFYFYNGFLNFNVAFALAIISLPIYILFQFFYKDIPTSAYSLLTPLYLWFAIMFTAPHKEERFLYPVYPFISFGASIVLFITWKTTSSCFGYFYKHMKQASILNISGFFIIYISLCCFRIGALKTYYNAPMDLYKDVYNIPENNPVICIGKEWHRFPSNFFVPHGGRVEFIKSSFKGQLPQHFSDEYYGTSVINRNQNDQNGEERSVYKEIKLVKM